MKKPHLLFPAFFVFWQLLSTQSSQGGYVNTAFNVGSTLFSNPLLSGDNTLNTIFDYPFLSNGTTVSLWDSTSASFSTTSVFNAGSWSINLTLLPGTGAKLTTATAFTNTFVGSVANHDGGPLVGGNLTPPPVFSGPNGTYLLADASPIFSAGTNIFLNIFGRMPNSGEQVTTLNSALQIYTTDTYLGNGLWDNIPTLNIGQAALFNINSVPEPSTAALGMLGLAFCFWGRRVL